MKPIWKLITLTMLCSATFAQAENNWYLKSGLITAQSKDTSFKDDNNPNSDLPLLFGETEIGAKGDWGDSTGYALALGHQLTDHINLEFAYSRYNSFQFQGNANFENSGVDQPVAADLDTASLMLNALYQFQAIALSDRIKFAPYLGFGVGQASHQLKPVNYYFPEFNSGSHGELAASITPAGHDKSFAHQLIAGLNFPIIERVSLDLEYSYTNLGQVKTNQGDLRVLRYDSNGVTAIDTQIAIQRTAAKLKTQQWMLALRIGF